MHRSSGNCPNEEENAARASLVGSAIVARLGAAAYPTTPMAVTVAPTATPAAVARNLTVRRRLGKPSVSDVRIAGVRRKGLVHTEQPIPYRLIETRRRERSVGVAPGSVLVWLRSWRTPRRSSISRRQSVQIDKGGEGDDRDRRCSGPCPRTLIAIRRAQRTAPSSRRPHRLQTCQRGGRTAGYLAGLDLNPKYRSRSPVGRRCASALRS
jgi:hypothetical protein